VQPIILTNSGIEFNLLHPDPDLIEIEDIAHALAHLCRFTGHTSKFYSVAEHSLRTSLCPCITPDLELEALLHDAAEAYVGDVSSPLKSLLPEYKAIENNIEQAIRLRFGLPAQQSPIVKNADLVMLATEKRDLLSNKEVKFEGIEYINELKQKINPLHPILAKSFFIKRFKQIYGKVTK
jgi:5'-deoxynucleotidase YfbR-like HD superfamily hydrolase